MKLLELPFEMIYQIWKNIDFKKGYRFYHSGKIGCNSWSKYKLFKCSSFHPILRQCVLENIEFEYIFGMKSECNAKNLLPYKSVNFLRDSIFISTKYKTVPYNFEFYTSKNIEDMINFCEELQTYLEYKLIVVRIPNPSCGYFRYSKPMNNAKVTIYKFLTQKDQTIKKICKKKKRIYFHNFDGHLYCEDKDTLINNYSDIMISIYKKLDKIMY